MVGIHQHDPKRPSPKTPGPERPASRRRLILSRVDQIEALASPVRQQILLTLHAIGPAPVRDLAKRMGREPEALYYHLKKLLKVGIIVETSRPLIGRRTEAVYDAAARTTRLDPRINTPSFLDTIARSYAAMLRLAERCQRRAIFADDAVRMGKGCTVRLNQTSVRLNDADLRELNRRINDLVTFLDEANDDTAEHFQTITIASSRSTTAYDDQTDAVR